MWFRTWIYNYLLDLDYRNIFYIKITWVKGQIYWSKETSNDSMKLITEAIQALRGSCKGAKSKYTMPVRVKTNTWQCLMDFYQNVFPKNKAEIACLEAGQLLKGRTTTLPSQEMTFQVFLQKKLCNICFLSALSPQILCFLLFYFDGLVIRLPPSHPCILIEKRWQGRLYTL